MKNAGQERDQEQEACGESRALSLPLTTLGPWSPLAQLAQQSLRWHQGWWPDELPGHLITFLLLLKTLPVVLPCPQEKLETD